MLFFAKRDSYSSTFIHPTSAPEAHPEHARYMIRVSCDHGATVHDFRFVSAECMEGFRYALNVAKQMGAKITISDIEILPDYSVAAAHREQSSHAAL